MADIRAARFGGLVAFGQCLDGARLTPDGFDADGDLVVDEPNDAATVTAVQQALADLGFAIGVDGDYGSGTAETVRQFKVQQDLPVPPGLTEHDGVTGPGTAQRLDELFSAFAVIRLRNEYGEALAGVLLELAGVDGVRQTTTDTDGAALADLGGSWAVRLDPTSTLATIGDLLGRTWPPDPPPAELELAPENVTTTTTLNDVPVSLTPGADLTVVVAARLQLSAQLVAPLDGTVRVGGDGGGVAVFSDGDTVTVALQANGGFAAAVLVDPVPSGVFPPPLPEPTGWVLPNGYVVRDGDTAAGLGELFLGDPDRFAELSDHDPAVGEVLVLPADAVPGWLALATDPPPEEPQSQRWFEVMPDDLLRVVYAAADPAPLHELLAVLDRPPSLEPDPATVVAARAEALSLLLAPAEVLGPEPAFVAEVVTDEVDG